MSAKRLGLIDRLRNRYFGVRRGVVRYPVQQDCEMRCYWKAVELGRGGAAAFYVHGKEVLRFDCFGPGGYHVCPGDAPSMEEERQEFSSQSTPEQIEQSVQILLEHLQIYLSQCADERIQNFKVDLVALRKASERMKMQLTEYTER